MAAPLPSGVHHCALHDRMYPAAMLCPSCVLGGSEEECTAGSDLPSARKQRAIALVNDSLKRGEFILPRDKRKPVNAVCFAAPVAIGFDPGFADAPLHITMAGCHCGDAACTRCDPMGRMVDGLTVRECFEAFCRIQQDEPSARGWILTPRQLEIARSAWSAQLRARVEGGKEKGVEVVVDDDRWEP